uniref:Ig-like domain-containing protein n=1 Tax=Astyanax mexicanus TaxID=7994 RepID=A0A8B9R9I5_ASTMX
MWTFGTEGTRIARLFNNENLIDYEWKFRDRLQLNSLTGSLTISNIRTTDTGLYKVEVVRTPEKDHNIHCVLFTAGEEVVKLQELEGNTVTLHTGLTGVQSEAQILWFYRSEKSDIKIVNSLIIRGEDITDYSTDRFRDRLQLIRSSGSLSIRNISREDSGVYTLNIITGTKSDWRFSVKVYAYLVFSVVGWVLPSVILELCTLWKVKIFLKYCCFFF